MWALLILVSVGRWTIDSFFETKDLAEERQSLYPKNTTIIERFVTEADASLLDPAPPSDEKKTV